LPSDLKQSFISVLQKADFDTGAVFIHPVLIVGKTICLFSAREQRKFITIRPEFLMPLAAWRRLRALNMALPTKSVVARRSR